MSIKIFYVSIITFLLGVFVATFAPLSLPTLAWITLLAVVCALFWWRSTLATEMTGWLFLSVTLVFFGLGALRLEVASWNFGHSPLETAVGEKVTLVGVVSKEPDRRENSTRLFVQTKDDLVLVSTDRYQSVTYGDEVRVEGKLEKPESFATEFGRTFNYPGYLLAKGVEYQISFATVEVTDTGKGNFLVTHLLNFKFAFMDRIELLIPEPAVGLGEGLLLGVKQALGDELETAFRKTGIIHIVVLSGYNIMLVVVFVMYILGKFFSVRPRVVMGILAIVSFALLVGLSATVVRASIMAILLLLAQAFGRIYLVLRGLLVAGMIMVLFNPYILVYDVGFQLSFLATLGLILVAPHLENVFTKVPSKVGIRMFLVATLATQIAVLPLLLYQIGEFSVVAVLVNILVLPMVPVAMLLTFLSGMVAFVSIGLASPLAYLAYWSLAYINNVALWFADIPWAAFVVPAFPFYIVPLVYAAMGYLLWRFYKPELGMGYGDMAEQLLRVDQKSEVKSIDIAKTDLSDWTIVEERDEKIDDIGEGKKGDAKEREGDGVRVGEGKKGRATQSPAPREETPIFFR